MDVLTLHRTHLGPITAAPNPRHNDGSAAAYDCSGGRDRQCHDAKRVYGSALESNQRLLRESKHHRQSKTNQHQRKPAGESNIFLARFTAPCARVTKYQPRGNNRRNRRNNRPDQGQNYQRGHV